MVSCGKCPSKSYTYKLMDKTKHYFTNGTNGSMYVYENISDSTDIDTLKIICKTDEFEKTEYCENKYESIKYSLISNKGDTLKADVHSNGAVDFYTLEGVFHKLIISCPYTISSGGFLVYPDTIETLPTYSVRNINYSDVIKITFTLEYDYENGMYYHAGNIGLIEFMASDRNGQNAKTYYLKSFITK